MSGQIGRDLKTQKVPEDFEAEVRQVLDNIGIILREAKMNYADVVSVQIYLTDMELFSRMNAVYTTYFKAERPSRTTVGVVPPGWNRGGKAPGPFDAVKFIRSNAE